MFEPINDHHAIQEVTFVLSFERPFTPAQLELLEREHASVFRKELPKKERIEILQFAIGNAPPSISPPLNPLSFSAFKRDGTVDWRLLFDQNDIVVNCLTYTRWKDVSVRALNLLRLASHMLMRQGNFGATSIALQYLDTFKWRGKTESYDAGLLLKEGSPYVPQSIFDNRSSPLWHLHQGWFSQEQCALAGRTLQRIHLDGSHEGGSYIVRMDATLRRDLHPNVRKFGDLFHDNGGPIASALDHLHQLDKRIIRSYITDDIAKRINLDSERVADL